MNLKRSRYSIILVASLLVECAPAEPVGSPDLTIAKARENVRISEEAERRIRAQLEALRHSPEVTPERLAEYRRYLARIKSLAAENRLLLQRLEAAHNLGDSAGRSQPLTPAPVRRPMLDVPPELTEEDELATLDRKLNSSLSAFDEMLLQEVQTISEQPVERPGYGAAGGEDAQITRNARAATEDSAAAVSSSDEEADARVTRARTASGAEAAGTIEPARQTTETAGAARSGVRIPPDIPDGSDDDIVARQIREAAENETDAVLRRKLWQEYRDYKKGAS